MILQKHGLSQEAVAAGLLHDILEDAEMTEQELKEIFNEDILELVKGASEKLENRDDTCWKDRKCHTIKYLKNGKKEIQYISCADKLSNAKSMLRDYNEVGNKLWDRFNAGYEKQKWYYKSLVDSLEDMKGVQMYEEFKKVVRELFSD